MHYIILFLEGFLTFLSPCLLPMLPVYVSLFAAGESNTRKALANALGFVLGFTLVFVTLGAFAGSLGRLLHEHQTLVNIVTGTIVILLGLHFMGVLNLGFLTRMTGKTAQPKQLNLLSALAFGVVFAIGWTPCVGVFLSAALMMASSQGGLWTGMAMLLVYALGLGIPFVLSAVLIDRLKGAFDFIKRHYKIINLLSGGLLVVVGILMACGQMARWMALLTF